VKGYAQLPALLAALAAATADEPGLLTVEASLGEVAAAG
jgi:hypothetical protein